MVHEVGVMAGIGLELAKEATVPKGTSRQIDVDEAFRMQAMLNFFYPVPGEIIPKNSFLREFIGGLDLS
jgi:hypothetical protein